MCQAAADLPQLPLESAGDKIKIDLALVKEPECADHPGHRVRMNVHGVHRDQGNQPIGMLDQRLGYCPRVQGHVVRIGEDAPAAGRLAPYGGVHKTLPEGLRRDVTYLRAGRIYGYHRANRRLPVAPALSCPASRSLSPGIAPSA
jgi:hypothetical protein